MRHVFVEMDSGINDGAIIERGRQKVEPTEVTRVVLAFCLSVAALSSYIEPCRCTLSIGNYRR